MKPSRDKNALARQHALNMYRAPNASRFAVGKIVLMFEAGAMMWLNQALRDLNREQYTVYAALGTSMSRTYDHSDSITGKKYGIMKRIALSELQRGMYAAFVSPTGTEYNFGKRIIALPGDIVRTRSDCVHNRYVKVPPGFLWIEGDAGPRESYDSNQFGPIAERIVADPKQKNALEANPTQLEFVAERKEEGLIIKQLMEREAKGKNKMDELAVAIEEKAVQFLREAGVRCAQVRAAKAKSKASIIASTQAQEGTILDRWRAHGSYILRNPSKDVFLLILPGSISEEDRRVLEKKAEHTKAKTGCSYQFKFLG
ncbi:serine protease 26A [Apiospora saccharicola]